MNRIEYMRQLAALLQDVPVEERVAAMQYYNDYFDDAGEENEQQVIAELGSPEKVAAEMKAGLGRQSEDSGEFRETGYTDTQFEEKEMPTRYQAGQYSDGQQADGGYQYSGSQNQAEKPWTNKWVKLALIIMIVLVAAPVLVPVVIGLLCAVVGIVIAAFAVFFALVVAAGAVAIAGIVLLIRGAFLFVPSIGTSLVVMGIGLILAALGTLGTVAAVRLCIIVLPGMFRFVVELCRRPFHRRKEAA